MDCINNYIYKKKLDLDLQQIKKECWDAYEILKTSVIDPSIKNEQLALALNSSKYNLFKMNYQNLNALKTEIKKFFFEINNKEYYNQYIHCWLNVSYKNQHSPWHNHAKRFLTNDFYHGFFCVDVEPSSTYYKFLDTNKIYEINDYNNLLIIAKTDNDEHRTDPWPYEDRVRITVAFNIVSSKFTDNNPINPVMCIL